MFVWVKYFSRAQGDPSRLELGDGNMATATNFAPEVKL